MRKIIFEFKEALYPNGFQVCEVGDGYIGDIMQENDTWAHDYSIEEFDTKEEAAESLWGYFRINQDFPPEYDEFR